MPIFNTCEFFKLNDGIDWYPYLLKPYNNT